MKNTEGRHGGHRAIQPVAGEPEAASRPPEARDEAKGSARAAGAHSRRGAVRTQCRKERFPVLGSNHGRGTRREPGAGGARPSALKDAGSARRRVAAADSGTSERVAGTRRPEGRREMSREGGRRLRATRSPRLFRLWCNDWERNTKNGRNIHDVLTPEFIGNVIQDENLSIRFRNLPNIVDVIGKTKNKTE